MKLDASGSHPKPASRKSQAIGAYAVMIPSRNTLASNPIGLFSAANDAVARLTTGEDQLCRDTLKGQPCGRLGMKQDRFGSGWVTMEKQLG